MKTEGRPGIAEVKGALEREGFKTSRRDPFFSWLHPPQPGEEEPEGEAGDILYVLNPPIPKIAPIDFSSISLRVQDQLLLQLSFYYRTALDGLIEVEDIERIYGRHASSWAPALSSHFEAAASEFSLQWASEYDTCIEDSLYGFFPFEDLDKAISLLRTVFAKRQKGSRHRCAR